MARSAGDEACKAARGACNGLVGKKNPVALRECVICCIRFQWVSARVWRRRPRLPGTSDQEETNSEVLCSEGPELPCEDSCLKIVPVEVLIGALGCVRAHAVRRELPLFFGQKFCGLRVI